MTRSWNPVANLASRARREGISKLQEIASAGRLLAWCQAQEACDQREPATSTYVALVSLPAPFTKPVNVSGAWYRWPEVHVQSNSISHDPSLRPPMESFAHASRSTVTEVNTSRCCCWNCSLAAARSYLQGRSASKGKLGHGVGQRARELLREGTVAAAAGGGVGTEDGQQVRPWQTCLTGCPGPSPRPQLSVRRRIQLGQLLKLCLDRPGRRHSGTW